LSGKQASPAGDRKRQIIKSTVEIMSEAGVAGATTARIAADVGVSEPALYRHFKNKQGMLLAALDDISARLIVHTVSAAEGEDDVVMQLRLMSAAFYDFVMSNPEETRVLFEVVSAVRGADMRTAVRERFAQLLAVIEAVLIDGVDRGALREDLDVYFASTLGLEDVLTKEKALAAVERLLESIETRPKERSGKQ
jgi:TetR/AcrR family transcriptional regulator